MMPSILSAEQIIKSDVYGLLIHIQYCSNLDMINLIKMYCRFRHKHENKNKRHIDIKYIHSAAQYIICRTKHTVMTPRNSNDM